MKTSRRVALLLCLAASPAPFALAAQGEVASQVQVVDGIVQPRRPIAQAIPDAIQFLRRADGGYVPGHIDGPLAGYFTSALVNADGSNSGRQLSFPARQHAYFIRTFLDYYAYTGENEWLQRAKDLADWNLAHSTPANAAYPNLPYSATENGHFTGSADKNSIETDKPAFIGCSYLALYESTADKRYLDGARQIAATLLKHQNADGSWPFRVIPEDGKVFQELGGAPVFFVEFFERLLRFGDNSEYRTALDKVRHLMIARNVEQGGWGTYHEDVKPHDGTHLGAEPMSFTADYLFRNAKAHPEYVAMGQKILKQMEGTLVHTSGHAAAPAPAVAEQTNYVHIMPGHTARYCLALADLYAQTGDDAVRKRALSGLNAATHMQSEIGLFKTYFYDVKKQTDDERGKPNWYSQHLYTVCHMLECMPMLPELAPNGQDHILGTDTGLHRVRYTSGKVQYYTPLPAQVTLKLSFDPKKVTVAGKELAAGSWSFNSGTHVLKLNHGAGEVVVSR